MLSCEMSRHKKVRLEIWYSMNNVHVLNVLNLNPKLPPAVDFEDYTSDTFTTDDFKNLLLPYCHGGVCFSLLSHTHASVSAAFLITYLLR